MALSGIFRSQWRQIVIYEVRGARWVRTVRAHRLSRSGDVADAASARPRPLITTISRALQWHYSDAPGGGAEMARAGAPLRPRRCCKYSCCCWLFRARPSTRRRDAVCSPF